MYRRITSTRRHRRLRVLVVPLALVAVIAGVPGAFGQRFVSIEPTVLLTREKDSLVQVAEVVVENGSGPVEASVEVRSDSGAARTVPLGAVKKGKQAFQVHVPAVDKPAPVEFILKAGGKEDRRKMTWQPQRRWEVCLVPISHHDLGYTDTLENVLRKYDGFYDDVLRFCDETADWPDEAKFRYTVEGTWSIQHFLENRPKEAAEKLAKYVREGRIEIPALFGNEITGLCSHEGIVRLMYPSFRIRRQFGAPIRTASITDIPGLNWGLPTVLAGAGVKYFFAGLPDYFQWGRNDIHTFWDEAAVLRHGRPDAFRWQGPDGKSVLVYYSGSYGGWPGRTPGSAEEVLSILPSRLSAMERACTPFSVVRYGTSGCGDNTPPEIKVSRAVREWNAKWTSPRLLVATNTMFFERLEKQCQDVRTFRGELPDTDYVVGAASTAEETSINRLTHDRLPAAEKFATLASLLARSSYPAEPIRDAYDGMLLYDEHTWGMSHQVGKRQDWNWADKSHYAYRAAGLAETVLQSSLDRLADQITREGGGEHIVVFNPLGFERTDLVRVPSFDGKGPLELVDEETGNRTPGQVGEIDNPQAPVPYGASRYARGQFHPAERFELVFVAEKVPALGWKSYRLTSAANAAAVSSLTVGPRSVENRRFKVTLDPRTGAVESIDDKELSRELVDRQARNQVNQLVVKSVKTGALDCPKNVLVRRGQSGPVYASLVASSQAPGCPQVTQEIILYDKLPRIDVANRVLRDSTPMLELYFAFPFQIDKPRFHYEGSSSVVEPFADQFPGSNSNYYTVQHWADVSGPQGGVALSAVDSHLLEFGGLWPCYCSQAHHGVNAADYGRPFITPADVKTGSMYAFVHASNFRTNFPPLRQGDLLFRYSFTAHPGDWKTGRARNFGWGVANPLLPVRLRGASKGPLGKTMGFCRVEPDNVMLLTLKQAEDGNGIIVRLIETEGREATAKLALPHATIAQAQRTSLVEENQGELGFTPHEIAVPIKPFEPVTVRLQVR